MNVSRDRSRQQSGAAAGAVSLRGLAAGYGNGEVISGVSIDFPANAVTTILGPGGSGKTTLLRVLGGQETGGLWFRGEVDRPAAGVAAQWQLASRVPTTGEATWENRWQALSRAAEASAALYLFDEPDVDAPAEILEAMAELVAGLAERACVVVVTHNVQFARVIADHVVLLIEGKLVEMGPAERVFARPVAARTQQFLRMGH